MHTSSSSRTQHRNTGADKSRTEKVLTVREFLESLAKVPSRYCQKDSHKLYLETVITSGTHLNLRYLQYLPDGSVSYKINYTDQWRPLPQRQRKNKADDNTITGMYKAPMRITSTKWQHLQQLKKLLPKDYHHFYDALPHGDWPYWTQELCQFWFQGKHPWTSKEHAQQSKD